MRLALAGGYSKKCPAAILEKSHSSTHRELIVATKTILPEQDFLRAVFVDEFLEERVVVPFSPDGEMALKELRAQIDGALDTLSYRDRAILEMRFGLGDGHAYTLAETGFVFQLTRERIRQLQVKALKKLRMRADDLRRFLWELG